MNANDFRNVLFFMCNKWSKGECNLIFNGSDFDPEKWKYSLGDHIWNKWVDAIKNHNGSLDCITYFLLNVLDTGNLQKLINRTIEYYK